MNMYFLSVGMYATLSLVILWIIFTITFMIAVKINLWKILDIMWGLSFIIITLSGWIVLLDMQITLHFIFVVLISLWGLRLSIYLGKRSRLKEDARYDVLKKKNNLFTNYFLVFLSQALFIWIMCIPLYFYIPVSSLVINLPNNITFLLIGVIISIIGLCYEWIADFQITIFKKPQQLVTDGLWKYSRHPNYFGEILFWWGIWIATLVIQRTTDNTLNYSTIIVLGCISMISPLTITWIISCVTGPMTEQQMTKYSDWDAYKSKTPYIIPFKFQ